MRRALFLLFLISVGMYAQDKQHILIDLKPAGISGTDDVVITKTAGGFSVTGDVSIQSPRGPITMKYEESVDQNWIMRSYNLTALVGGNEQKIQATRNDESISMLVEAGGQKIPKEAAWNPDTIVLDNFIGGQLQILLNAVAAMPTRSQWQVLVPQRLTAATASITSVPADAEGRLNQTSVALKKFNVQIGGSLLEVWAEAKSNEFLMMRSPLQQFEMKREGFLLVEKKTEQAASNCQERKATFPSENLEVPAVVCIPISAPKEGKLPVVVMVHGSGPHDADETIGPNKPFRDLAEGLAAQGIASVRYDKRTHFAKSSLDPKSITVQQETITDAVNALKFAAQLPEANPGKVFLLGHSLGGSMAPFIAEQAGNTRGLILLAAAAVPLDQTILRQTEAQMRLAGVKQEDIDKQVSQMREQFNQLRAGKTGPDQNVLGAPAHYWADLLQHDTAKELAKLREPILVLQGGKDIQVVKEDYDVIKTSLTASTQAQFNWFPELNHLFMPVDGPSTGAEYGKPGHVAPEVSSAIATWIKSLSSPDSPRVAPKR